MKNTTSLLDIIKDCRTMDIIRKQELNSTKDHDTLQHLFSTYVEVSMENLVDNPDEIPYYDFYRKVVNKLKEIIGD